MFFKEEELKKQIKSGDFARIYVLYGDESYLKQYYAELIASKTVEKDFKDFNLHILDGTKTDINTLLDCVLSFPMMGGFTCTVVTDYPLMSLVGDKGKINGDFDTVISQLPETTVLVFKVDSEVDQKNAKWTKLLKYIDSNGGVCAELCKRTSSQLVKLITDSAKRKGCEISREDAYYMLDAVGDDMSTLRNELDKVCAYKKEGTVTRADIDAVAVTSVEAKVFSLSRYIVSGDADNALLTLSNLFKLREEPVAVLGVLSKAYVDMYRVKAIKEKGIPAEKLSEYFPASYRGRSFIITNAARDGAKYSLSSLKNALSMLFDADRRLKSTNEDQKAVLEELVLRLLRI